MYTLSIFPKLFPVTPPAKKFQIDSRINAKTKTNQPNNMKSIAIFFALVALFACMVAAGGKVNSMGTYEYM
jgi:hypothetical protein